MSAAISWDRGSKSTIFAAFACLLLLLAIVHAAWLCDDAFITLRSVDNWVHGYGPRWNVAERVQSFTHPLWFLLVSAFYALTRSPGFALITPALLLTGAFLWLFVKHTSDRLLAGALVVLLASSKAFVEFSTSGLENPLLHLLLLGYCLAFERALRTRAGLDVLVLCSSLLLITRLDMLVLLAPSLGCAAWLLRRELLRVRTWLMLAPFVLWELFSLLYYGFAFPNTAYAKLNTGVPRGEAIAQGFHFVRACFTHDPITVLSIALAIIVGLIAWRAHTLWLALGLLSWQLYLIAIGGDFMIGRMLTPALVVALVIFAACVPHTFARFTPLVALATLLCAVALPRTALLGAPREVLVGWLPDRVTDERAIFYQWTGVFRSTYPEGARAHPWVVEALAHMAEGERVFPMRSIGFAGYFAGATAHIVDEFALAEPLLARLPANPAWSPGHFDRKLPAGYLETLRSGKNQLQKGRLADSYNQLCTIVRGPVWSTSRFATILRWMVRRKPIYPPDYEVRSVPFAKLPALQDGAAVKTRGVLPTGSQGLSVALDKPTPLSGLTVVLGGDDNYLVAVRLKHRVLFQQWLEPEKRERSKLRSYTLTLPEQLTADSVLIRGRRGDAHYHVGGLSLRTP